VNTSATPDRPNLTPLRDPDRRLPDGRELRLVWDLGADPEGGTRQAVLSIGHHKKRRGGSFTATLLNQTEEGNEQRMGAVTDWKRIAQAPAARYSARQLEEFADTALAALRAQLDLGDPLGFGGYFEVTP
jgi:hypothetical protein